MFDISVRDYSRWIYSVVIDVKVYNNARGKTEHAETEDEKTPHHPRAMMNI